MPWGEMGNVCQSSGSAFCHIPFQGSTPGLACTLLCALLSGQAPNSSHSHHTAGGQLPLGCAWLGAWQTGKHQADEEILYLLPDWLSFKWQQPCGVCKNACMCLPSPTFIYPSKRNLRHAFLL